eukprot:6973011-Alexandrium_andersonii.AAC.1
MGGPGSALSLGSPAMVPHVQFICTHWVLIEPFLSAFGCGQTTEAWRGQGEAGHPGHLHPRGGWARVADRPVLA